ncbi:conserved hypothetical protein [Tenacibaculum maritimum]|uniref:DUF2586 family protein n=1 Tax=Tenacibaculum maritimum TaxID=107401 RepID=UPI0012E57C06|nr:DUF2586 family protein [Tenacibaculum maritimum]CAA0152823.1 conserved hypothetical protein [Tenacibaculum maritimum]
MADLNGVNIEKGRVGSNRNDTGDSISGLVITSVKTDSLELNTPEVVYNLNDVKALGITAEFDKQNNVHVYRHFSEFYRQAGEGVELYIMLVAQTKTITEICDTEVRSLLLFAKGKIRQLAIAINIPEDENPIILNGLPTNVQDGIPKAQGLAKWAFDKKMPCQIFLEGYAFSGDSASVTNLRAIENVKADKVSVFIGQDFDYASKQTNDRRKKFADVGTLLGVCSKAKVHQNVGNNEEFNLTDSVSKTWVEPGLSSHTSNIEAEAHLQTLEDKGFIFGVEYTGLAGVRFNNDHTCAEIIVDQDNSTNEHSIAYGRVNDKAVRSLRSVYIPKVKTDWAVNPKTGKLPPGVVVALEDLGDAVFENMEKRGEITFGKTAVDKNSDLLIEKVLKVGYNIVPKGGIGEIKGIINLKTKV